MCIIDLSFRGMSHLAHLAVFQFTYTYSLLFIYFLFFGSRINLEIISKINYGIHVTHFTALDNGEVVPVISCREERERRRINY